MCYVAYRSSDKKNAVQPAAVFSWKPSDGLEGHNNESMSKIAKKRGRMKWNLLLTW
jgi:hypothetical protein